MFGKKHIPWNKGLPMSEGTKLRVSLGKRSPSAETRAKLSACAKARRGIEYKGKVDKICGICKKPFRVFPYLREKAKFCSAECRVIYVSKLNTGENNPRWKGGYERRLFNNNQRRVRKTKNGGSHTFEQWNELKQSFNFTCPSCSRGEPEIRLSRDHIIPLSRGGSDNIENIQPLCRSCNTSKYTDIITFIPTKT